MMRQMQRVVQDADAKGSAGYSRASRVRESTLVLIHKGMWYAIFLLGHGYDYAVALKGT